MTTAPHHTGTVTDEPLELLRSMLEEQLAVETNRLTELALYGELPGHGGHDQHTLDRQTAATRQDIADTVQALRRMTDGTYGICEECERPIPLGRLHIVPHARHCSRCAQRHPG